MTTFHLPLLLTFFTSTTAKVVFLLDGDLEKCVEPENDDKLFDISDLDVIFESDTDIFINGSVKFLKTIRSPLKVHAYAEQYVRSQWVISMIDKRIADGCASMHNPLEPWYNLYKNLSGCPLEAGVRTAF
jgi:hypothetical protein